MEKIWDYLNSEELTLTKELKAELDRRIERIKKGEAKFFTWEQVKSELKSTIKNYVNQFAVKIPPFVEPQQLRKQIIIQP